MRQSIYVLLLLLTLFCAHTSGAGQEPRNSISLSVMDQRKVISQEMGRGLLIRVVKEESVNQAHFGWRVEVVRKPYRQTSRNLVYHNKAKVGGGTDSSQVYAWHVAEHYYPNERELKVSGYPYLVKVVLEDCLVEGKGPEAGFVSGKLTVTWKRQP